MPCREMAAAAKVVEAVHVVEVPLLDVAARACEGRGVVEAAQASSSSTSNMLTPILLADASAVSAVTEAAEAGSTAALAALAASTGAVSSAEELTLGPNPYERLGQDVSDDSSDLVVVRFPRPMTADDIVFSHVQGFSLPRPRRASSQQISATAPSSQVTTPITQARVGSRLGKTIDMFNDPRTPLSTQDAKPEDRFRLKTLGSASKVIIPDRDILRREKFLKEVHTPRSGQASERASEGAKVFGSPGGLSHRSGHLHNTSTLLSPTASSAIKEKRPNTAGGLPRQLSHAASMPAMPRQTSVQSQTSQSPDATQLARSNKVKRLKLQKAYWSSTS
jgi:hypothetical protein